MAMSSFTAVFAQLGLDGILMGVMNADPLS
jgi:hypothetical protein